MEKREQLYEGKAKKVYRTSEDGLYLVSYKDDATAFNGKKKGSIKDKGIVNNTITNYLMQQLEAQGIPTHFVRQVSERETLVRQVTIIPLEVVVRNVAAGSLAKRLGVAEGTTLRRPVIEYCYKNDALGDPMVNDSHILAMGWATETELAQIAAYAQKINQVLKDRFQAARLDLIDFKLEFGKTPDGKLILADEISPDTCRLWDSQSGKKLDKDRFRRDLGDVEDAYWEVMERLMGQNGSEADA